jgi:transposase InsO family protein
MPSPERFPVRQSSAENERLAGIKLAFSRVESETRASIAVEAREQAEQRLCEAAERRAIAEYVEHYHFERNHQGLGNTIPFPSNQVGAKSGKVVRRKRLGGLLNYYERLAA